MHSIYNVRWLLTNEIILTLWILFWVIFLVMSIIEKRGVVFGFFAGLWILFLGIYIYVDGIDLQSGVTVVTSGAIQTMTYTYAEVVPPFQNYGLLWAIPFVLLGLYIMYLASTKDRGEATT